MLIKGGSQREFNESAWTRSEYIYDTVEMFDIYNSRWQQVTPMNSGRILPGIAVLNGKGKCIYLHFSKPSLNIYQIIL